MPNLPEIRAQIDVYAAANSTEIVDFDGSAAYETKSARKAKLTPQEGEALAASAKQTLAALDGHGDEGLPKMLAFGEAVYNAKARVPHGAFKQWCLTHLDRRPSWVSTYRRLFEEREHLEFALAWAREQNHRLAHCRSVEYLLKLIEGFKSEEFQIRPRQVKLDRGVPGAPKNVIAEIQERLDQAQEELSPLRELIPEEIVARLRTLALAAATGDAEAKAAFAAFKQQCRSRLQGLGATETSSSLEVSNPSPVLPTMKRLRPPEARPINRSHFRIAKPQYPSKISPAGS